MQNCDKSQNGFRAVVRCSALRAAPLLAASAALLVFSPAQGRPRSRPVAALGPTPHCAPRIAMECGTSLLHSQQGCEVSRNPEDSGKDQPADGWLPGGSIQKKLVRALCRSATANFSSRLLAYGAVFGIGCVCIAVLNGSGSLELRRRRIKSANRL